MDAIPAAAWRTAHGMARALVAYALPPRCPGCGVIVAGDAQFCLACWNALDFLDGPACLRCSIPLPLAIPGVPIECGACLANPPPYWGAPAAVAYGPVARTLALRLKYGRRLGHARLMARLMQRPLATLDGVQPRLLVPIPLHRWRLWMRGFNQSARIGRELAALTGFAFADDLVLRHRATPSLRGLDRKAREKTVRGAFRLAPDGRARLAGQHVILIDDVHASGATLRACSSLIARSGAARVSALSWARVVPNREAFDFAALDSDMDGEAVF